MRAPVRLALAEGLVLAVVGGWQMVNAGKQRTEEFAVIDHAADRDAAEADAVIAAFAPDQAGARTLAADIVICEGDLERGVDRLRARIAEEHVIELAGGERGDAARELERLGMGELESGRVIERRRLGADRRHDRIAIVPGIGAPHAGGAVEHGAALRRVVGHVLGARDQARGAPERPGRGERKPKGPEGIWGGGWSLWCFRWP